MTNDLQAQIQKKIEQATEKYATGNHRSSFADTADARAFTEGAALLLPRLLELVEAMVGVHGCFDAAFFEGLDTAIHEAEAGDSTKLLDLLNRRILFAHGESINALTSLKSWAGGE